MFGDFCSSGICFLFSFAGLSQWPLRRVGRSYQKSPNSIHTQCSQPTHMWNVTAGWVRGRQKSSTVPRLMWKGMGPSFSYLFLISTCFLSVLASQNPQLKYTEISPWQSLSTGSSPVKWAPVSKEDIWGWEGGISLTPLLFAGLDVCSTQDRGHKNCFGTCSSWEQPCVSTFQAEFEQPTTHPAAWRAGMVRIALTIMPTWQKILLPTQKRWREAHTRASTIPARCPVCLAWFQWHIQIRPWTFPEAAHSSNTTAPRQPPPTAARQRDKEVVPSFIALLDNRRSRQRRDTGEFPPLTQLLPAHSSTYSYWFLCLTD